MEGACDVGMIKDQRLESRCAQRKARASVPSVLIRFRSLPASTLPRPSNDAPRGRALRACRVRRAHWPRKSSSDKQIHEAMPLTGLFVLSLMLSHPLIKLCENGLTPSFCLCIGGVLIPWEEVGEVIRETKD